MTWAQAAACLFHRYRAAYAFRPHGRVRAGIHPVDGAVFSERPFGRQQNAFLAGGLIQRLINSRDLPLAAALSVLLLSVTGAVIAVYRKLGGSGDMSMF